MPAPSRTEIHLAGMPLATFKLPPSIDAFDKAVDEFGFVAEEYAQDGFHDKGIALLSKAQKLAPLDQSIRFKIERIQRDS